MEKSFLPVNRKDMELRGWKELDFVLISGDAYVDHPSFGHAVILKVLEHAGYRIGIIPQPDWRRVEAFTVLGRPRLAFLITAGNLDSMVNLYTVFGKKRGEDAYAPGGRAGKRPDRALIVYTSRVKQAYKGVPVILGGIEASLRRLAHYDYWSDKVRRSVLLDAKADLLIYGMGEQPMLEVAARLKAGQPVEAVRDARGTVCKTKDLKAWPDVRMLADFERLAGDKKAYAESFRIQYENSDPVGGPQVLAERAGDFYVVQNPPALPLDSHVLDRIYGLPYAKTYHPMYEREGGVPALKEVRFSLTSARGCFGECAFCALTFHQGRHIQARSHGSLEAEARALTRLPGFKGNIHDVGGPTANFRLEACEKARTKGYCTQRRCLAPGPCPNLHAEHGDYLALLRKLRVIPGIKRVFIRSGIRYDYLLADRDEVFLRELCEHHVSGQLKLAPEHVVPRVLELMGKPPVDSFLAFSQRFRKVNQQVHKKQYILPYFISSHPGSDLKAAVALAEFLLKHHFIPDQVQDFYPTPGTLSTCMYYTGLNPLTGEPVYVPRTREEKRLQRALLHFRKPENRDLVLKALKLAGRGDLIGYGKNCLIRP